MKEIRERIDLLMKKSDAAQRRGDYKSMEEYDKMIRLLREEEFEIMKQVVAVNKKHSR